MPIANAEMLAASAGSSVSTKAVSATTREEPRTDVVSRLTAISEVLEDDAVPLFDEALAPGLAEVEGLNEVDEFLISGLTVPESEESLSFRELGGMNA